MGEFERLCDKIKKLDIQGAENIARTAVRALLLKSDRKSINKLLNLRPTEPCLRNAVNFVSRNPKALAKKALKHFDEAEKEIARLGSKKVGGGMKVFTHCHSTAVMSVLKEAAKTKKFRVYNTETRPMRQGRITAKELAAARIPVTHFVDSAARVALMECGIFLMGADAVTSEGVVFNKIGSGMLAEAAKGLGVPVYVCTDSWKFDLETVSGKGEVIEMRSPREVWERPPKGVKVLNPSFEAVEPRFVNGIISELGVLKPRAFARKAGKELRMLLEG